MKKTLIKGFLMSSILLSTSCIKDEFVLEECLYKLRVELDFINTKPLDDKEQLRLVVTSATGNPANTRTDLSTDIYGRDLELLPDTYHFVIHEPAENISVVDNIVILSTNEDGTAKQPTTFSGGVAQGRVEENVAFQLLHVPLHLQTRKLIVEIKFSGVGVPYLQGIIGSLDNIAISRLINNGFEPIGKNRRPPAIEAGTILYNFTAKDKTVQTFIGSNILLGIDGRVQQTLNLEAKTSLGIIKSYKLDVTEQLGEFHIKDVHEPWHIRLELSLDSKLEMTIEDWKAGPESNLIAQ